MNLKTAQRPCPVCEHPRGERLHTQRFVLPSGSPLKAGYDIVACEKCGFCYADTAVTQREYDEYYNQLSKYADSTTSTGAGLQPWDAQRLHAMAAEIADFAPDRQGRIADIGCANGGLLRELRGLGFTHLCGIDPSPACAAQTRSIPGVEARTGFISNMPESVTEYDGLLLSHVLEHVRDLLPALGSARETMKPDSWIYVETPDAGRYQDFVFSPFQDFNTEHINHFSLKSLGNLLRRAGFEPVRQGCKLLYSAPELPFPAVYIIARKQAQPLPIVKDDELKPSLETYIRKSRALLEKMDARIREYLGQYSSLAVWGAGQLTLKLLAETALAQANIKMFVDGNPVNQHQTLNGRPIIAPAELDDPTLPILVTSTINHESILASIRRLGLPNPILGLNSL